MNLLRRVFLFLLVLSSTAAEGAEFRVNTYTTGDQGQRNGGAVDADDAGNFVVVWESSPPSGGQSVFAQRFDATAQPIGSEFNVTDGATSFGWDSSVAVRPDGSGFVVVWQRGFNSIHARTFDGSGAPLIPEFQVNTVTGDNYHADVAVDATGRFTVVWAGSAGGFGIRGRRFEMDGTPLGGEFIVNSYPGGVQTPRIAARGTGEFLVTWWGAGADDAVGIFARRFAVDGTPVGGDFRVNEGTFNAQTYPGVALAPDGGFMVVWEDPQPNFPTAPRILARRFDALGDPLGPDLFVDEARGFGGAWPITAKPTVAAGGDGSFLVAYTSNRPPASFDTMATRFSPSGVAGPRFRLNAFTTGPQVKPAVAAGPGAGEFVVTWNSQQDGWGYGVFGTRIACPLGGPVTSDDAGSAPHGSVITFEVLTNDVEPNGYSLAVTATSPPSSGGTVTINPDQSVTFTPPPLFVGTAVFTYTVENPCGLTDTGTVTIELANNPPQATTDTASTPFGAPVEIFVLANDFDSDGDAIRLQGVQSPTPRGGIASLDDNGTPNDPSDDRIDYTPAPGVEGIDLFEYVLADAPGATATGFVFVTIAAPTGLAPSGMTADVMATSGSDGNGVLEPGEQAIVRPRWRNATIATFGFTGLAGGLTGASGTFVDASGTYSTVGPGQERDCDPLCYAVLIDAAARPATHWDAQFAETLSNGDAASWSLHLGDSFPDVPRANPFYRHVETLLHRGVTAGCTPGLFCPASLTTRAELATLVLRAKEGPAYVPPACGTPRFLDVPAADPFCPWVEEAARRGVDIGCGLARYCPGDPVLRQDVSRFLLKAHEAAGYQPPACGTAMFADVPAWSPACGWIEELARRGVVIGCAPQKYCPTRPVTREQLSAFLTGTFGLTLYGP